MYRKLYKNNKEYINYTTNYMYCNVCDFLIFISEKLIKSKHYQNNYFKRCINKDIISNEHIRRKKIL